MGSDHLEMHNELQELFGHQYDVSYIPVWHGSWHTYEENGWVFILEHNGSYYSLEGGHCVMADCNDSVWDPVAITQDQALEIMFEWEEIQKEMD